MYYKKLEHKKVECVLCPRQCVVDDWERGYCGVRENRGGTYYTFVHSQVCSANNDPIEKKPLFHFLPGTNAFSIATAGCNMLCKFCQNWQISQARPEQLDNVYLPPAKVVEWAKKYGSHSIAYTYTEPVVFYEFMLDTSRLARQNGLHPVMISNGYIKLEPMRQVCQHLSAVKIDLKAYTEKFYKKSCASHLQPVLDVLQLLRDTGVWYEIVYLVIPTLNDDTREIEEMSVWIRDTLGPDVPVHFSRFHPQYMLKNLPPTPLETIEGAWKVAVDVGLRYVYIGNVPGHPAESTYCPQCQNVVVRRVGYRVHEINLDNGACSVCGERIPGVWA
ncbi:MAG: AmmeMemoRadiSam system radical SAM enzyme [Gemmatimonadota bacterium]|nr:MAG: AmmeMemoRadiSam system radical SAM enzyme [Gemmatimonadota bacterium]